MLEAVGRVQAIAWQRLAAEIPIRLQTRMDGAAPTSARALYDDWIEAAESAWAELAREPAFVQAQADAINAAFHLAAEAQLTMQAGLEQAGVATRAQLESLETRVRELELDRARRTPPR